jgi:hypothetical protein
MLGMDEKIIKKIGAPGRSKSVKCGKRNLSLEEKEEMLRGLVKIYEWLEERKCSSAKLNIKSSFVTR